MEIAMLCMHVKYTFKFIMSQQKTMIATQLVPIGPTQVEFS